MLKISKKRLKELNALLLPPKLRIGAQVWTVEYAHPDDAGMKRAWGITSADDQKITMTEPLGCSSISKYFEVCLHELLHAVWSIGRDWNKKQTEEDFAIMGGIGLSSLFADNPVLITWIKACSDAIAKEREGV